MVRGHLQSSFSGSEDGIKDRDKQLVMNIVKQIATFKNNEYVLLRGVWNDVQEDWPCYTEQERQLLKRSVKNMACMNMTH